MKQIIFFDVDGVLIHGFHYRPERRHRWDIDLQNDFGIDCERLQNEFFKGPFQQVLKGTRDLLSVLREYLPLLGYHGNPQKFLDYWLTKDSKLNQDLLTYIEKLKVSGQVRLFIATNQEHTRAHYLMETLGLSTYFEDIFYSARVGAVKTERAYYDWITSRLALPPDEKPILFDDTPAVLECARTYGWEAIEFLDTNDLLHSPFVNKILNHH